MCIRACHSLGPVVATAAAACWGSYMPCVHIGSGGAGCGNVGARIAAAMFGAAAISSNALA
eukprot:4933904-Pleurochrysis_carterae.AAC.1